MVDKVYMYGEATPVSGVRFDVSWDRIEDFLRGEPDKLAGTSAMVKPHERCDFQVTGNGITVTIK